MTIWRGAVVCALVMGSWWWFDRNGRIGQSRPFVEQAAPARAAPEPARVVEPRGAPSSQTEGDRPSRKLFFASISAKDPSRAVRLLQEALAEDPTFESARERVSQLLLESGKWIEARDQASACLNGNPRNITCHATLIEASSRVDGPEDVLGHLRECQLSDPVNGTCLKSMIRRYLDARESPRAAQAIELYVELDPSSVESHLIQARYFEQTGQTAEALEHYREACRLGSESACDRD